jgi:hypothetical protein
MGRVSIKSNFNGQKLKVLQRVSYQNRHQKSKKSQIAKTQNLFSISSHEENSLVVNDAQTFPTSSFSQNENANSSALSQSEQLISNIFTSNEYLASPREHDPQSPTSASPQPFKPLFDQSKYSATDASRLIVSFVLRYSLSDQASKDLVHVIKQLLPAQNCLPKSYKKMFKNLVSTNNKIKAKNFCIYCSYELNEQKECLNSDCDQFDQIQFPYDTFHYVDIKTQIEEILNSYWKYIEEYKNSEIKNLDFINSSFYKAKSDTIHLYLCSDGVPVFKHPSRSAYPVYLNIVELPPFLRETKRTKIIAGVWFGTNQPTSDILFSELLSNVQNLEISIRPNDENICLKAKLHVAQGDLPFKAKMLDMKSHKGFFCCPYCLIRGKLFLKK